MHVLRLRMIGIRWPLVALAVVGMGLSQAPPARAQADAASDDDGRLWYAMPEYMPPEVAEFDKIDPDGMADVTFREGISLNPGKTEHLELAKGYFVAFSLEMDGFKPKRAWVFLARVDEVTGKNKAKVRLSKETAAMLNDDHHVTFFKPKNATKKQLQAFPTTPVEVDLQQSFAPREEPAPAGGLPDGPYLLLTKDAEGTAKVEVVKPMPASEPAASTPTTDSATTANAGDVPFPALPEGAGEIDAKAPKRFRTTKSGLKYRILRKGTGRKPTDRDGVNVHSRGWLDDGTLFTDNYESPMTLALSVHPQIGKGLFEGLQLVEEGGMIELIVPPELAYGEQGLERHGVPPNATVHFLIELVKVTRILR
jgi:FKBP-type peptidyl-prolyl cis-trans isomerase FkpA